MQQKDELRRLRFVIGGSTGIDIILRKLGAADKLIDFFRVPVEPLAREDGEKLLRDLAASRRLSLTDDTVNTFFALIGAPVPYFIHLLFSQILLDPRAATGALTPERVGTVYTKRVLGPTCHSYFDYYRQRLKRYGRPGERSAIAILRALAEAPNGRAAESMLYDVYRKARKKGASDLEFREIMADLECDWYVSLDTGTNEYFFQMELMRAWWERFYRSLKKRGN